MMFNELAKCHCQHCCVSRELLICILLDIFLESFSQFSFPFDTIISLRFLFVLLLFFDSSAFSSMKDRNVWRRAEPEVLLLWLEGSV